MIKKNLPFIPEFKRKKNEYLIADNNEIIIFNCGTHHEVQLQQQHQQKQHLKGPLGLRSGLLFPELFFVGSATYTELLLAPCIPPLPDEAAKLALEPRRRHPELLPPSFERRSITLHDIF